MSRAIRLLLVVLTLLGITSTAAQAARLPTVGTGTSARCCYLTHPTQIRPGLGGTFVFGGVGPHLGNIDWTYWNAKSAAGTSIGWQGSDCDQSGCGAWRGWRVRLWLYHPVLLNGQWNFTSLKFAYRNNVPKYMARDVYLVWNQGFWRDDASRS